MSSEVVFAGKKTTYLFEMPHGLKSELKALSKKTGLSMAELARIAIQHLIEGAADGRVKFVSE